MADSKSDSALSVLFVSQYYPPETGAASTRVDELTKRWADREHDVSVLTSAPDYPEGEVHEKYENNWLTRETHEGVTVYITKTIPASNEGFTRRALKFVWFMIIGTVIGLRYTDPDIVVATSPQPLTGVIGWFVSCLRNAEFVFEIRDQWPESISAVSDLDNRLVLTSLDYLMRFVYSTADRIVVVSKGFVPDLVESGVDESDIWFHPNGVSPDFFMRGSGTEELSRGLKERLTDHFVVSYIGTIGRAHGLSVVLDAADILRNEEDSNDVLFVLVGFGSEVDRLKREAAERELDNVIFVGRRPKEDVPAFLEFSDVSLVHLKDRELFRSAIPSKMFEAMASRTPVALGVRGEAKRIIKESEAGIQFEPENPEKLAEAVFRLRHDDELYERCQSNTRAYVEEEFSWDKIASCYCENLERLGLTDSDD